MKILAIVALLVAVAAGSLMIGERWHSTEATIAKPHSSEASEGEPASPPHAELERALARAVDQATQNQAIAAIDAARPKTAAVEPAVEGNGVSEPKSAAELAAAVEEAFQADKPPTLASTRMAARVTDAFRGANAEGTQIRQVDCRETRCRVSLEFKDAATDKHVLSGIFGLLGSSGVDTEGLGFIVSSRDVQPDGSVMATIHLYRGQAILGGT
jgi:hypothetical protein